MHSLITQDPKFSVRCIENEANINRETAGTILKNELQIWKRCAPPEYLMNFPNKQKNCERVNSVKQLRSTISQLGEDAYHSLAIEDESWFFFSPRGTKQETKVWICKETACRPQVVKPNPMTVEKSLVLLAFTCDKKNWVCPPCHVEKRSTQKRSSILWIAQVNCGGSCDNIPQPWRICTGSTTTLGHIRLHRRRHSSNEEEFLLCFRHLTVLILTFVTDGYSGSWKGSSRTKSLNHTRNWNRVWRQLSMLSLNINPVFNWTSFSITACMWSTKKMNTCRMNIETFFEIFCCFLFLTHSSKSCKQKM